MTTFTDDGTTYVSSEPCHYGMFRVPPPTVAAAAWLEGLRAYRQFEPYPWHEVIRVDEVA